MKPGKKNSRPTGCEIKKKRISRQYPENGRTNPITGQYLKFNPDTLFPATLIIPPNKNKPANFQFWYGIASKHRKQTVNYKYITHNDLVHSQNTSYETCPITIVMLRKYHILSTQVHYFLWIVH